LGSLTVTFYGVRGSTPCHHADIARYGGNTSCVGVDVPGEPPLMFDLGTGVRYLGANWPVDAPFRGACLLSHLHWDHTQGLPFFAPILQPDAELDIYAPEQGEGGSVEEVLRSTICPPLFPINIAEFPGTIRFHDTAPGDFMIGGVAVKARLIPHVGPTLGYRIEWNGRSVAYISDHQQPYDGSYAASSGAIELLQDVDLMIHDSQYTPGEFAKKFNWGHCTTEYAMWLAGEVGAKRLVLFHHDPMRSDDALDRVVGEIGGPLEESGCSVVVAREGLRLTVP
jgi:phosphoribosyl 1,2-cyclic phosphodiesterase